MDFPLLDLLAEGACYDFLVDALHPAGLRCPSCGSRRYLVHRAHRTPVLDYRCGCGRVCNAQAGTACQGTQRTPAALLVIVRGIAQGTPTAQLARELGCARRHLLELRHRLQPWAWVRWPRRRLPDDHAEAAAMFPNAGEKGMRHANPLDPPRRRAHQARGHGTFANDRPPIAGVSGRETGLTRCDVLETVAEASLQPFVERMTEPDVLRDTDEASG